MSAELSCIFAENLFCSAQNLLGLVGDMFCSVQNVLGLRLLNLLMPVVGFVFIYVRLTNKVALCQGDCFYLYLPSLADLASTNKNRVFLRLANS